MLMSFSGFSGLAYSQPESFSEDPEIHARVSEDNPSRDDRSERNPASLSQFHHPEFTTSVERALVLTGEQKEAFHQIETAYKKMVITKEADIRTHEIDLAQLLDDPQPDRQALKERAQLIGAIKADLMMARMESLLKLKALLTKAQYDQFRTILRNRMEHMVERSPH